MIVRSLASEADYAAAVRLQRATWGPRFRETVPASLLKISNRVGGLAAGAFAGEGSPELVGFVYGITGLREGRLVHWSHMLAVRPDARDRGIGRALKDFQRTTMRGRGIGVILWSFDPLVARNAWLNLVRLGAHVQEYVEDMYPASNSPLHGFGTDRLVVAWDTEPEADTDTAPRPHGHAATPGAISIEIPPDILEVAARAPEEARAWRRAVRARFTDAFGRGSAVTGFERDDVGRCFYHLADPALRPPEQR